MGDIAETLLTLMELEEELEEAKEDPYGVWDELDGARGYFEKWERLRSGPWLKNAHEELGHAADLVAEIQASPEAHNPATVEYLNAVLKEHALLLAKVEKAMKMPNM